MSLATGGCLWFPDLTAADPLHVLPFALSAVLVMNVLPGTRAGKMLVFGMGRGKTVAVGGETPLRLTRAFLIMALAIGPCTMDLPAAIHLYWLSSASLTLLQAKMIPYLLPMPMTDSADMRPCTENEMRFIRPTRGDEGEKP
ncbi:hypothetical protein QBC39DRAFT_357049 [Podospora conica]|nr:hypothetical protein QBC39DRAFT_357049 [Schizothecium conicum]